MTCVRIINLIFPAKYFAFLRKKGAKLSWHFYVCLRNSIVENFLHFYFAGKRGFVVIPRTRIFFCPADWFLFWKANHDTQQWFSRIWHTSFSQNYIKQKVRSQSNENIQQFFISIIPFYRKLNILLENSVHLPRPHFNKSAPTFVWGNKKVQKICRFILCNCFRCHHHFWQIDNRQKKK